MIRTPLALAAIGATLGTALDALHVLSDTTRYAEPILFGIQAWWTPPLFAGAAVALGAGRILAAGDDPPRTAPAMAVFVCAYVASAALDGLVRTIVVVALAAIACACDRGARAWAFAVWAAIFGTAAEIALVRLGAFAYTQHGALGVPDWLPFLYVTAAIGVGALARAMAARGPLMTPAG